MVIKGTSLTLLAIEHRVVSTVGHVSVNIGAIQIIPYKNTSIEQIIQQADESLYLVEKDTQNVFKLLELDQSKQ